MKAEHPRILIVEDEQAHAELIQRAFETSPMPVCLIIAHTLLEARAHIVASPPDVVISDLALPDGQGIQLLPFDQRQATFPIVIMTSQGNERMAVEAIKSGALDYVVKSAEIFADMPHIAERALREWHHILERQRVEAELEHLLIVERQQRLQADTLREVAVALSASLDQPQLLQLILDQLVRVVAFDSASIMLCHGTQLHTVASRGLRSNAQELPSIDVAAFPHLHDVLSTCAPVIISDTTQDSRWTHREVSAYIRSWLGIPLIVNDVVIGLLNLDKAEPEFYQQHHATLALAFAGQAAIAIENARLYKQAQQEIAQRKQIERVLMEERASLAQKVQEQTAELRQTNRELQQASRLKDEFLANMSHELRTPLNAILGYAHILQQAENLTEHQREGLKTIKSSGKHLLNLINEILELSKLETNQTHLHNDIFNLPECLHNIARTIQGQIASQQIRFCCDISLDLPVGVRADEKHLQEVLMNLLNSAVSLTKQGTIGFRVFPVQDEYKEDSPLPVSSTSSTTRTMKHPIHFSIEASGMHMTPEQVEELFTPFQQFGGQHDYSLQVTSLELAICRKLIYAMGGKLAVQAMPDGGSRLSFELSLPEVAEYVVVPKIYAQTAIGYTGHPRTILVVDDHEANRAILADRLLLLGFRVFEAENGQDCIEKALQYQPDIILLDLWMPMMNGFEAAQHLRQSPDIHDVVIIAISASIHEEIRQKSLEAGCHYFLPKPVHFETLLALFQTHLHVEWIYQCEETSPASQQEPQQNAPGKAPVAMFPAETVNKLLHLAKLGIAKELLRELTTLERQQVGSVEGIKVLRHLVKTYQFDHIIEVLTAAEKPKENR